MGACGAAFRLVNALFIRPLPIANSSQLFAVRFDGVTFQGEPAHWDSTSYVHLMNMRAAVRGQAEVIGVEYAQRYDLTYGSDQAMEKVTLQHVSGWLFPSFGVKPALGRLFTENDDRYKNSKPYAVISYQYWKNRFGHVFMPMRHVDATNLDEPSGEGSFVVRMKSTNPLAQASSLQRVIQNEQPSIRISNASTQADLVSDQLIRERLLTALGGFFAAVALLLAMIGLYGVLNYSVQQREREIGIRIALGATAVNITRIVTLQVFAIVLLGTVVGLGLGEASTKYVQTLLYGVRAGAPSMLILPALVLVLATNLRRCLWCCGRFESIR